MRLLHIVRSDSNWPPPPLVATDAGELVADWRDPRAPSVIVEGRARAVDIGDLVEHIFAASHVVVW